VNRLHGRLSRRQVLSDENVEVGRLVLQRGFR